ncbi:MAG: type II toxin-antitoxin system prevent-host-death family antitoxin [Deltaproteobacteria bacterium]|nr:type II toxin-antitoxin system prevent-host-death family antitoxin [Deltaproteobacteria bacterium]
MAVIVEAQGAQLARLLERVRQGEEVVLAEAGEPVAKLVPVRGPTARRTPGSARGRIRVADDFDAPLPPDVQATFDR